ncbi:unnamed protein product [Mytilus edulis]|uniref:Uncharacterized protein n=1 Tax=Mytilus edulis TaxID=6550 RepID=A0A8S3RIY9_MYTED|nr:unnamed protein product [Mytilus edulis]
MNVLHWIRGRKREYKPFVANRIGEIHTSSHPTQWRHVPTKVNPADLVSRGRTVKQLQSDVIWWNGPKFLQDEEPQWPDTNIQIENIRDTELRCQKKTSDNLTNCTTLKSIHTTCSDSDWRLDPVRYSSFVRLVRVQAYVHRFIDNCRLKQKQRRQGSLSTVEYADAELETIKNAQREAFLDEYNALMKSEDLPKTSKLLGLQPRIDENRLIRCDGRLEFAEFLSFDARYPIILPRKNWVTKLIVKRHTNLENMLVGQIKHFQHYYHDFGLFQGEKK